MKKQFQILSIVIAVAFFSCDKHNAEITGTISAGTKETSINSLSQMGEPDPLFINNDGRMRFNAEPGDEANEPFNSAVKENFIEN